MFNRIVVPLDGTELAERALPFAEEMAALTGTTIHLVRVVDPVPSGVALYGALVDGTAYVEAERADQHEAGQYLDAIADELIARGYQMSCEVRVGPPTEGVVSSLRSTDLLVIASHGRAGLPRLVLGSVAQRVVQHTKLPVLLVRS